MHLKNPNILFIKGNKSCGTGGNIIILTYLSSCNHKTQQRFHFLPFSIQTCPEDNISDVSTSLLSGFHHHIVWFYCVNKIKNRLLIPGTKGPANARTHPQPRRILSYKMFHSKNASESLWPVDTETVRDHPSLSVNRPLGGTKVTSVCPIFTSPQFTVDGRAHLQPGVINILEWFMKRSLNSYIPHVVIFVL